MKSSLKRQIAVYFLLLPMAVLPFAAKADSLMESLKRDAQAPGPRLRAQEVSQFFTQGYQSHEDRPNFHSKFRVSLKNQCLFDEHEYASADQSLFQPLRLALQSKNLTAMKPLLAMKFKVSKLAVIDKDRAKTMDGIEQSPWLASNGFDSDFRSYLSHFSKIEDVDFQPMLFKGLKRNEADNHIVSAAVKFRFDFRGIDQNGKRRNDRGLMEAQVTEATSGIWKMQSLAVIEGESLMLNRTPAFVEATDQLGAGNLPLHLRREAIRRGGYGTAIGDIGGNGNLDIYLGTAGEPVVLRGQPKGGFKQVDYRELGLEADTMVKSAIFADLNNDGYPELILTRFEPRKGEDIIVYRNNGKGHFAKIKSPISGRLTADWPMPATVADFNSDGFLDLYVGFPGEKDFTTPWNDEPSLGKTPNGLFVNQAGKGFRDATIDFGLFKSFISQPRSLYPHAALAVDFDQDGHTDLIVVDDRGQLSRVLRNKKGQGFEEVAHSLNVVNSGNGMGIAVADFNGQSRLDIVMSNVNLTSAERFLNSCVENWNSGTGIAMPVNGLRFFEAYPSGKYVDATVAKGLNFAGEGLSGVTSIDYNNDGLMDLYVTNGLWSGSERGKDISSLYLRSMVNMKNNRRALKSIAEKSQIIDMLAEYRDPEGSSYSFAGYQRNRLFRNRGDGTFMEVGYLENVDAIADGYMATVADVDNSGRMSLILRNADPGDKKYVYPTLQIYKNAFAGNNSLSLKLIGKASNRDAIGASVLVELKRGKQVQQVPANTGAIQPDKRLVFGMGQETQARRVKITWPSGRSQVIENLPAGFHTLSESEGSLVIEIKNPDSSRPSEGKRSRLAEDGRPSGV